MTIEFLILNSLFTMISWAVILGMITGLVIFFGKIPWKYGLIGWFAMLACISYIEGSADRPKTRLTVQTESRVVDYGGEIVDNSPKGLSDEERLKLNQQLYDQNK